MFNDVYVLELLQRAYGNKMIYLKLNKIFGEKLNDFFTKQIQVYSEGRLT